MTRQTLILRNASIIDGMGNNPAEGDISIAGDRESSLLGWPDGDRGAGGLRHLLLPTASW
tara:strand:- start:58 stop:237 length:180 start_codon:yes stop_codon:yes gene_type:complete